MCCIDIRNLLRVALDRFVLVQEYEISSCILYLKWRFTPYLVLWSQQSHHITWMLKLSLRFEQWVFPFHSFAAAIHNGPSRIGLLLISCFLIPHIYVAVIWGVYYSVASVCNDDHTSWNIYICHVLPAEYHIHISVTVARDHLSHSVKLTVSDCFDSWSFQHGNG